MGRSSRLALLTLLIVFSLSGCSIQTAGEAGADIEVRVVATENFGAKVLLDEVITVSPGTSAMDALRQIVKILPIHFASDVVTDEKGEWTILCCDIHIDVFWLQVQKRVADVVLEQLLSVNSGSGVMV